jgi:hypothetical protein
MEEPSAPPKPVIKPAAEACDPCQETWMAQCRHAKLLSTQWLECAVLALTVTALFLCGLSYLFCPNCLFAILLFCAFLCPCIHPLNAPLWVAIILLIISGWSFTTGAFSVSWGVAK